MFEKFWLFVDTHPELAAVLVTSVVWPAITGLLSLGYHRLEVRYPTAVAYLRAAGLDLPRTLSAIRAAWPKRLPPPPPASVLLLVLALGGGDLDGAPHASAATMVPSVFSRGFSPAIRRSA